MLEVIQALISPGNIRVSVVDASCDKSLRVVTTFQGYCGLGKAVTMLGLATERPVIVDYVVCISYTNLDGKDEGQSC